MILGRIRNRARPMISCSCWTTILQVEARARSREGVRVWGGPRTGAVLLLLLVAAAGRKAGVGLTGVPPRASASAGHPVDSIMATPRAVPQVGVNTLSRAGRQAVLGGADSMNAPDSAGVNLARGYIKIPNQVLVATLQDAIDKSITRMCCPRKIMSRMMVGFLIMLRMHRHQPPPPREEVCRGPSLAHVSEGRPPEGRPLRRMYNPQDPTRGEEDGTAAVGARAVQEHYVPKSHNLTINNKPSLS